jgi:hypothetical protein
MYKVIYTQNKTINGNKFSEVVLDITHQNIEDASRDIVAALNHAKSLGLTQGRDYEVQLAEVI